MKAGKKPTLAQKKLIEQNGIDPLVWLVSSDTTERMILVHRYIENTTSTIYKENGGKE